MEPSGLPSFNLVDESWIPVSISSPVNLKQAFSADAQIPSLGGTPIQRIALFKLLLAIGQAAWTPKDEKEWAAGGAEELSRKALAYLDSKKDCFFLYGPKPFLQMPAIAKAEKLSCAALDPATACGNTTLLTQLQRARPLSDAGKALLLVTISSFATGGKKTDNSIVLTPGYAGKSNEKGKASTGKPGSSLGARGFLHSFVKGKSLLEEIWLNLLDASAILELKEFPAGLGVPPWEKPPSGEDDAIARRLASSYMGRLVPLCRFALLDGEGIHYSEGLSHPSFKDGVADLSMAIDRSAKDPRALWCDPAKRPWRLLGALLSFVDAHKSSGFECKQLAICLRRGKKYCQEIGVWSAGLKVSGNAGEQYASGDDDFVFSDVSLRMADLDAPTWFPKFKTEMESLEELEKKRLYGRVSGYFSTLKADSKAAAGAAASACQDFWGLCEKDFQSLVNLCAVESPELEALRKRFRSHVLACYDKACPKDSARQLDAWARNLPFGRLDKHTENSK